MTDCATCVVRNRAICASLNPAELVALGKMGRRQKVRAGQTLLWEGDGAPVVANVLEGVLKLVVLLAAVGAARIDRRSLPGRGGRGVPHLR